MIGRAAAAAALWLACLGAVPVPARHGSNAITVADFTFNPRVDTVAAGDTVVWVNRDSFVHVIAADSGAFRSGELGAGGTFRLPAPEPGRYPYHCAAHPVMRGVLVVN